ncbi:hypothetical protein ACEV6Q_06960 [Enterobacter ludwigii]|uniref:hypothetical protein n=1 Tax=Enterobacter ludwigii TaxID=299767 RepID=UPI003BEF13B3
MNDNKLTEAQLLFRLQQFHGAELEATEMGDHEFAHECADVASIIREVQGYRKAAGKPVLNVLFKNGWPVDGTTGVVSGSPSFPDGYHDFYADPQSMLVVPEIAPDTLRDEIIDLCAGYEIGDQGAQEIWEACRAVIFASSSQEATP